MTSKECFSFFTIIVCLMVALFVVVDCVKYDIDSEVKKTTIRSIWGVGEQLTHENNNR